MNRSAIIVVVLIVCADSRYGMFPLLLLQHRIHRLLSWSGSSIHYFRWNTPYWLSIRVKLCVCIARNCVRLWLVWCRLLVFCRIGFFYVRMMRNPWLVC